MMTVKQVVKLLNENYDCDMNKVIQSEIHVHGMNFTRKELKGMRSYTSNGLLDKLDNKFQQAKI